MIKKTLILGIGILAGLLIVLQWRAYSQISVFSRGQRTDITQEISLLVQTNADLRTQVTELTQEKEKYSSFATAAAQTETLLKKYNLLTGQTEIKGQGVTLTISTMPTLAQMTDLLSEIFQLGSQAVAINNIYLTNETAGLASYNNALVFNGQVLSAPLEIKIIGNSLSLREALSRVDSTLFRITSENKKAQITLQDGEIIIPSLSTKL